MVIKTGLLNAAIFFMFFLNAQSKKNFILIAPPGAGKGTLSQYLIDTYDYYHICPGNICRYEIRNETSFGKEIAPIVKRGELINDEIMFAIVMQHILKALTHNKNFIIDGFPRTVEAFQLLSQFLEDNNLVKNTIFLHLVVPDQVCIDRIAHRYICPECDAVYNTELIKPEKEALCDRCLSQLIQRSADTLDVVKKRLMFFHGDIEPLLGLIEKKYQVYTINTAISFEQLRTTYDFLVEC